MPTGTTTGASRRPRTFYYLGRPAALYTDAMSKRRARPVTPAPNAAIPAGQPAAVVTGAGRGIGRLLALRLSDVGYAAALVARSQQDLRETARLIEISGGRALCPIRATPSCPHPCRTRGLPGGVCGASEPSLLRGIRT
jgi:short chain dehydrogenase